MVYSFYLEIPVVMPVPSQRKFLFDSIMNLEFKDELLIGSELELLQQKGGIYSHDMG